ncbi:peptidoglycan-binding protein [Salicibibacter cibarius]|uniref:Peptidoglycan-binding protein n=1 Tax=Salicibibacter cibarius TaxID=2743000 RepID=A0A7T6Z7S1_9BACI|nr:peptidoglycan-binding protein [Salicibibacter cibarius]
MIRENPSALPEYGIDGIYGEETDLAVQDFQSQEGLTVDGIAGPETNNALREAILFGEGSEGEGVEMLQEDLTWFYFEPDGGIDGIYGPGTEQAVRDFQSDNDLSVDGIAGPNTLEMMDELIETILVEEGDANSLVRRIQEQLNEQDEVDISIDVDGSFGPETEGAIEDFQEVTDQQVDGIAGPVTMNLLDLEAFHPSTEEELNQVLEDEGYEMEVEEQSEEAALSFVDLLQSSEAYQNNLPSEASDEISDPELTRISRQFEEDDQEFYLLSGSLDEENGYIHVFATFDEDEEILNFGFGVIEGDLYESPATLNVYDVDGETVEEEEDTVLEFTNAELDIQNQLTEAIFEANESDIRIQVEDPCDFAVAASAGIACGVPGLFAGTFTAGIGWLVFAGVCGATVDAVTPSGACS